MNEEKKNNGITEVTKELIGWEGNKILLTVAHLTTKPGQVITAFCNGEKNKYLSPAVYFLGVTGLNALLYSASGLFDVLIEPKKNAIISRLGFGASDIPVEFSRTMSFLVGEIGQKTILLPIVLLLTWLFYKRYNQSFKENSWFVLYATGHATLLATPTILYWYLTKDTLTLPPMRIAIEWSYLIWASMQFYKLSVPKAIFLRIGLGIAFMLTVAILAVIAGRTYALMNS